LVRFLAERLKHDPIASDFTPENVRAFLAHHAKNVLPATSYQCHVQIGHLDKWLKRNGYITQLATIDIPRPDIVRNCRPLPSAEIITALESSPDRLLSDYRTRMARAVLSLLFLCGLRPGEVKKLRLQDYDRAEKRVLVRYSKGRKTRYSEPPEHAIHALNDYLDARPTDCKHDYFFAYDRARRLGDEGLRKLFRELLAVSGNKDARITPHVGRHICTSRLFANNVDINTIRSILGHASFATTIFYAHSTPELQRAALERAAGSAASPAPESRKPVNWF
jgi:site-specific recombinase XerD